MVNFTHIDDDCSGLEIEEKDVKNEDLYSHKSPAHPQPWCGQHLASTDTVTKNFYNYTNQDKKEKTPMCRIAELSRYHKFKYNYKLMDESGPAHKKLFTVELVMSPDHMNPQIFEGSGLSIKKAQQAAADEALKHLSLSEPPDRMPRRRKPEIPMSPVQVLSQVMRRLQLQDPVFRSIPKKPQPLMANPIPPPNAAFILHPGTAMPIPTYASPVCDPTAYMTSPCEISLTLYDGKTIIGTGLNFVQAKDNAAAEALRCLAPTIQALDWKAEQDRRKTVQAAAAEPPKNVSLDDSGVGESPDVSVSPDGQQQPKHRQKSVISYVHECALQMKLNVQFEVLVEDGPPHERSYVVQCSLLNVNHEVVLQDTGDGRKKKEATQTACFNVLNRLKTLDCAPQLFIAASMKQLIRKTTLPPKETKRKTIVKDMKMDPSYGHQINPVSRLIQVLQARGEPEAQFTLVGEHGQSRYKEFVMEVVCGERYCTGSGPNKRLAKRAAAEAMLSEIGYVKPLPAPGKSLLKKKNDPMSNIGVFDLNSMNTAAPEQPKPVEESGRDEEPPAVNWDLSVDASSPPNDSPADSSGQNSPSDADAPSSPVGRRRVTFNTQVKACPPPEDANYPKPELAPLKADVVVEGKLKRLRKAKEGKRSLTQTQIDEIADSAKVFLSQLETNTDEGKQYISRARLEEYSERYKFSVQYTNFPKSPDGNDQTYFALVSLGLEKPLVCHGSGQTVELAADNAAFNAILNLSRLNDPTSSPTASNSHT